MLKQLLVILLLLCVFFSRAQDAADTAEIPPRPKLRLLSNGVLQLDNRTEPYYNVRGRMNGLKLGLEFYKRFRIGIGVYGNNDYYRIEAPQGADSLFRTARFNYQVLFAEAVIFRNWNWEISLTGAYGNRGRIRVNSYNNSGDFPVFQRLDTFNDIEVSDIGLTGYFKVFPWLGLGLGTGFRQIHNLPDGNLRGAFSDPYVDFKMKVFVGYAYRGIFKPESIKAEKAYYDYRKVKRKANFKKLF